MFVDWASLYQKPRTAVEEACFARALGNVGIWYAHRLSTVMLVGAQALSALGTLGLMSAPRAERGWPFFEDACSALFKDVQPAAGDGFEVPAIEGRVKRWRRTIAVGDIA